MLGILLALISGTILAFVDAGKKVLTQHFAAEVVIIQMNLFGVACNLLYFGFTGFPTVNWSASAVPFIVCGIIGLGGEFFIAKALQKSDFSLIMPIFAFIPVFSALLGFMLFQEVPTTIAFGGIVLVILGTYLLGFSEDSNRSLFSPLYNLLQDRGCQYMFAFSLFAAASCIGQRYGAKHSSPMFFLNLLLILNVVVFYLVARLRRLPVLKNVKEFSRLIVLSGIFWWVGISLMFVSYNLTLAAYAGSAMQIGTVVSILIGALYFKERAFRKRIIAGSLMTIGVLLVTLYG